MAYDVTGAAGVDGIDGASVSPPGSGSGGFAGQSVTAIGERYNLDNPAATQVGAFGTGGAGGRGGSGGTSPVSNSGHILYNYLDSNHNSHFAYQYDPGDRGGDGAAGADSGNANARIVAPTIWPSDSAYNYFYAIATGAFAGNGGNGGYGRGGGTTSTNSQVDSQFYGAAGGDGGVGAPGGNGGDTYAALWYQTVTTGGQVIFSAQANATNYAYGLGSGGAGGSGGGADGGSSGSNGGNGARGGDGGDSVASIVSNTVTLTGGNSIDVYVTVQGGSGGAGGYGGTGGTNYVAHDNFGTTTYGISGVPGAGGYAGNAAGEISNNSILYSTLGQGGLVRISGQVYAGQGGRGGDSISADGLIRAHAPDGNNGSAVLTIYRNSVTNASVVEISPNASVVHLRDNTVTNAGELTLNLGASTIYGYVTSVLDIAGNNFDGTGSSLLSINYGYAVGTHSVSVDLGAQTLTIDGGVSTLTDFDHFSFSGPTFDDHGTVNGSVGADTVYGQANADIYGLGGDDNLYSNHPSVRLWGGDGNDTLRIAFPGGTYDGGAGIDTASFLGEYYSYQAVNIYLGTSDPQIQDYGYFGTTSITLTSIENLVGSPYDDVIEGNAGNNVLDGGGGSGHDRVSYAHAASGVKVSLALTTAQNTVGAGVDTIKAFGDLEGSAFNDTLTGDAKDNVLYGGAGNDTLTGGAGNDTLVGGAGDNKLVGGAGIDTASYADAGGGVIISLTSTKPQNTVGAGFDAISGVENVIGSAFDDLLTGSGVGNLLDGGGGNDILIGGGGADMLRGGVGADTFVFKLVGNSTNAKPDQILDFSHADGDRIDLSAIDANTRFGGDQAFAWVTGGFTKHAGELFYDGSNLLRGDINGDSKADFSIFVYHDSPLVAPDFIL